MISWLAIDMIHDVSLFPSDTEVGSRQRLESRTTQSDNLTVRKLAYQSFEPLARMRFVIDDQYLEDGLIHSS